jgi:hypothetical protein
MVPVLSTSVCKRNNSYGTLTELSGELGKVTLKNRLFGSIAHYLYKTVTDGAATFLEIFQYSLQETKEQWESK